MLCSLEQSSHPTQTTIDGFLDVLMMPLTVLSCLFSATECRQTQLTDTLETQHDFPLFAMEELF
jgi:hypothetical protein